MNKRDKKIRSLQSKMRRRNKANGETVFENTSKAYVSQNLRSLSHKVKKAKKEAAQRRTVEKTNGIIDAYNETQKARKAHGTTINTKLTDSQLKTPEQKAKVAKLRKVLSGITKSKLTAPDLVKVKDVISGVFNTGDRSRSIAAMTRQIEDKKRHKLGQMSTLDEIYYQNYLRAALRVGAFQLFDQALKKGWSFVKAELAAGRSITVVYDEVSVSDNLSAHLNPFTMNTPYMDDASLEKLGFDPAASPTKRPRVLPKDTPYGSALLKGIAEEKARYKLANSIRRKKR